MGYEDMKESAFADKGRKSVPAKPEVKDGGIPEWAVHAVGTGTTIGVFVCLIAGVIMVRRQFWFLFFEHKLCILSVDVASVTLSTRSRKPSWFQRSLRPFFYLWHCIGGSKTPIQVWIYTLPCPTFPSLQ